MSHFFIVWCLVFWSPFIFCFLSNFLALASFYYPCIFVPSLFKLSIPGMIFFYVVFSEVCERIYSHLFTWSSAYFCMLTMYLNQFTIRHIDLSSVSLLSSCLKQSDILSVKYHSSFILTVTDNFFMYLYWLDVWSTFYQLLAVMLNYSFS